MSVEFGSSINTLPSSEVNIVSLPTLHVKRTKHHTLVNFIPEHYTPHRPLMRLTYGHQRIVSARTFDETRTDIDYRQALDACIADRGGVYPDNKREVARLLRQIEMQFITPTISVDFRHAHAYIYSSNDEHPFKTFPIQIGEPLIYDHSTFKYQQEQHLGMITVLRPDGASTLFQFPIYTASAIPVSQFCVQRQNELQ